jgi:superfamily II DNA or RNA helicase
MSRICPIIFDESACVVHNSFPALEQMLHYRHRSVDAEAHGRPIVSEEICLFNLLDATPGARVIQTFQGLRDEIAVCCQAHGYEAQLHDRRLKFPSPQLHLMGGFRFTQQQLVIKALTQNRSGCIAAPTRFGKTTLLLNVARAFPGLKTVIAAPGVDLLKQLQDEVQAALPRRTVSGLYTGSRSKFQGEDITVCSLDSIEKCDHLGTKLVLIDEPHAAVSSSRAPELSKFVNARKIGFGATLSGRFDNADILIKGVIGPVLSEVTYKEARNLGAVAPIEVAFLRRPFIPFSAGHRDVAYNKLVLHNPEQHQLIAQICQEAIPPSWQTLLFIKNERQAEGLFHEIPTGTIVMAKRLTGTERRELTERVKSNEIKRCICSDVYSQGVTFHEVRAMINAGGGGGSISCIQKPGRLAEIRPGKKCGVVIDFLWEPQCRELKTLQHMSPVEALDMLPGGADQHWKAVVRDSWTRHKVYQEKGYNITYHDNVADLATFMKSCQ